MKYKLETIPLHAVALIRQGFHHKKTRKVRRFQSPEKSVRIIPKTAIIRSTHRGNQTKVNFLLHIFLPYQNSLQLSQ